MLKRLVFLKWFHSLIVFFLFACLFYILYAGVTGSFNVILLVAIVAVFIEGALLILNKWRCPLTILAEKCGAEKGSVADICLPPVIARNAFKWGTVVFAAELILLGIRYFIG